MTVRDTAATVLVVGAGRHGAVAAAILRAAGRRVGGFLDDDPVRHGSHVDGVPVLGGLDARVFRDGDPPREAFVGIGNNAVRRRIGERLRAAGVTLARAVHPAAVVMDDVEVGSGSLVAAGAVIVCGGRLGEDVVVNTRASLDHDTVVEAGAYVSPGVTAAGAVRIGERAFVGVGAVLGPNVTIGACSVVGAASLVLHDVPPHSVAWGTPARIVERLSGEPDFRRVLAR